MAGAGTLHRKPVALDHVTFLLLQIGQQGFRRCLGPAQAPHILAEGVGRLLIRRFDQQLEDSCFQALAGDGVFIRKGAAKAQLLDLAGGDSLFFHLGNAIMGTP